MTHFNKWAAATLCGAGLLAATAANAGVSTYTYNALGQMTQASYVKGSKAHARVISHTFDARGNRTQVAVTTATGPGGGTSNHAPVAVDDHLSVSFVAFDEETMLYGYSGCLEPRLNDVDADNDPLTITSGWDAPGNCFEVLLTEEEIGAYTDSFSYSISDGHGGTSSATIFVGVE